MAPTVPLAPRELPDPEPDAADRLQVLSSVDNLSEDDVMGLQSLPNNMQDPPLGDQILVDLSSTDLLSVINTLETNNDPLSTGDAESIFPLDLPETADSESDPPEQKVLASQVRLEKRSALLLRRLRILQARALGKRVSEEASQVFEKCTRGARKDGGGRPIGLKALLKRVETTATLQASAAARSVVGPKYYNAGTSRGDASSSASVGISSGTLTGLEDTAGALKSHLSVVKHELDSDATDSSSGAESNDEAVSYNNTIQQQMSIEKRALWTWQRERASIASRWGWLQAQVRELDYKIRQHSDLHKQVREAKGPVEFEGSPVGYEGSLPGDDEEGPENCARIRPLRRDTFKKRKLLLMHDLHVSGNKASKPSDIRCSCQYPLESCAVCTGRAAPTCPSPPHSTLAVEQRLAREDPGYHPVLSDIHDVGPASHMAALCSRPWFRPRVWRAPRGRLAPRPAPPAPRPAPPPPAPKPTKGKPQPSQPKMKRGRPPLSRKIKEREREEENSGHDRGRVRASTESRSWRRQSYDIDNIVIPLSVTANNRPLMLEYKEILTPRWRVMEIPNTPMNNGVCKTDYRMSYEDSDDEDVSESAIRSRHSRAEARERSRYIRKQRVRRSHHDDAPLPPDLLPDPPPPPPPPPQTPLETIPPYLPRQFPLPEDTYLSMLSAMPHGYRPASPSAAPSPRPASPAPLLEESDDDSSTLSPASPSAFEGDDPDDQEWEPAAERVDRRKNTFR